MRTHPVQSMGNADPGRTFAKSYPFALLLRHTFMPIGPWSLSLLASASVRSKVCEGLHAVPARTAVMTSAIVSPRPCNRCLGVSRLERRQGSSNVAHSACTPSAVTPKSNQAACLVCPEGIFMTTLEGDIISPVCPLS